MIVHVYLICISWMYDMVCILGGSGASYEMFVMPLVKAVQELSAKVDALETKVAALEGE